MFQGAASGSTSQSGSLLRMAAMVFVIVSPSNARFAVSEEVFTEMLSRINQLRWMTV